MASTPKLWDESAATHWVNEARTSSKCLQHAQVSIEHASEETGADNRHRRRRFCAPGQLHALTMTATKRTESARHLE